MKNTLFFSLFPLWKPSLMVLAIAGLLFVSNLVSAQTPANIQGIEPYLNLSEDQNMYLVIRASLRKNSLEEIADEFDKKGVHITYSNVEYNSENLLTRIAMEVTIGDCELEDGNCYRWQEEAYNNGQPLDKNRPLIFYLYRKGQQVEAAGISFGYPENLPKQEIRAMKNMTGSIIGTLTAN